MNSASHPTPRICRKLGWLRLQIRGFILIELVLMLLAWFICLFWFEFALDYLPVQFGYDELSQGARVLFLFAVIFGTGYFVFCFGLQRLLIPLQDKSLAILIEKKYPEFSDALITSVETEQGRLDEDLLRTTVSKADERIQNVRVGRLLNWLRILRFAGVTSGLLISMGLFSSQFNEAFCLAAERFYALKNTKWPRQCHLEMVGLKVKRDDFVEGIPELDDWVASDEGDFKIAKGSSLRLLIRALVPSGASKAGRLPKRCLLRYWGADRSGVCELLPLGAPTNGKQLFSFDGQPFESMLDELSFDIRGGDHRIGPFHVKLVDEPVAKKTELDCTFPDYLAADGTTWAPRSVRWNGRAEFPVGTQVVVRSEVNKPLKKVYVANSKSSRLVQATVTESGFEYSLPPLSERLELQFYLVDQDLVVAESPLVVKMESVLDQAPDITSRLSGIGTSITPNAIVPFVGEIVDDYGVGRQWIEIENLESGSQLELGIPQRKAGELEIAVDFRKLRQNENHPFVITPGNGSQVSLVVKAEDRFDLDSQPNQGVGVKYELDVVTDSELLRLLEQLEVNQRRRLEQIYQELTDARSFLVRSLSTKNRTISDELEPEDAEARKLEPNAESLERKQEMRLLFCQRARLQVDKSAEEVQTVFEVFEKIREQLINNRVDAEDRKKRLAQRILSPLQLTVTETFPKTRMAIVGLETPLKSLQIAIRDQSLSGSADDAANAAIKQVDILLRELDSILSTLVKYETQNELLEIVRTLLKKQKEIHLKTEQLRKQKAFEGLLD